MQFINNNTYYIFILILTICIVKIVKLEKLKYDPNKDNVEVLDYKTIGKTIFNSNKATVLQFFCMHYLFIYLFTCFLYHFKIFSFFLITYD